MYTFGIYLCSRSRVGLIKYRIFFLCIMGKYGCFDFWFRRLILFSVFVFSNQSFWSKTQNSTHPFLTGTSPKTHNLPLPACPAPPQAPPPLAPSRRNSERRTYYFVASPFRLLSPIDPLGVCSPQQGRMRASLLLPSMVHVFDI